LVTPARNEVAFIEQTIKSVVAQTILPIKLVVISDGSTDGSDDIVKKYSSEYKWIELVPLSECPERNFAGKVQAFNSGYAKLKHIKYDIIGNLDADISFDEIYFSFPLSKFAENPRLGVAGTPFKEGPYHMIIASLASSMSQVHANYSGVNVSKKLEDISR
jgi:biofilm PGA synthesis N-glycosyltransferase PgaC